MSQPVIKTYIEFRDGAARITDTNIKAERVARMHVNAGASVDEVMTHYGLSRAQVYAALAYFHENRDTLDADYEAALQAGRDSGAKSAAERMAEIRSRRDV